MLEESRMIMLIGMTEVFLVLASIFVVIEISKKFLKPFIHLIAEEDLISNINPSSPEKEGLTEDRSDKNPASGFVEEGSQSKKRDKLVPVFIAAIRVYKARQNIN